MPTPPCPSPPLVSSTPDSLRLVVYPLHGTSPLPVPGTSRAESLLPLRLRSKKDTTYPEVDCTRALDAFEGEERVEEEGRGCDERKPWTCRVCLPALSISGSGGREETPGEKTSNVVSRTLSPTVVSQAGTTPGVHVGVHTPPPPAPSPALALSAHDSLRLPILSSLWDITYPSTSCTRIPPASPFLVTPLLRPVSKL